MSRLLSALVAVLLALGPETRAWAAALQGARSTAPAHGVAPILATAPQAGEPSVTSLGVAPALASVTATPGLEVSLPEGTFASLQPLETPPVLQSAEPRALETTATAGLSERPHEAAATTPAPAAIGSETSDKAGSAKQGALAELRNLPRVSLDAPAEAALSAASQAFDNAAKTVLEVRFTRDFWDAARKIPGFNAGPDDGAAGMLWHRLRRDIALLAAGDRRSKASPAKKGEAKEAGVWRFKWRHFEDEEGGMRIFFHYDQAARMLTFLDARFKMGIVRDQEAFYDRMARRARQAGGRLLAGNGAAARIAAWLAGPSSAGKTPRHDRSDATRAYNEGLFQLTETRRSIVQAAEGPLIGASVADALAPLRLPVKEEATLYQNGLLTMSFQEPDAELRAAVPDLYPAALLGWLRVRMSGDDGAVLVLDVDKGFRVTETLQSYEKSPRERVLAALRASPELPLVGGLLDLVLREPAAKAPAADESYAPRAWKDPAVFGAYEQGRRFVRPAIQEIVRRTLNAHVPAGTPLLEVGSGAGELAAMLPEERRRSLTETDGSAAFLALNPDSRARRRLVADIHRLPFADGAVPVVLGHAVLDTVLDLDKAAAELFRVLTPGGQLIHFLDLKSELRAEMLEFESRGLLLFADGPGLLAVDKEELRRSFHLIPDELRHWAQAYLAQPMSTYTALMQGHPDVAQALARKIKELQIAAETIPSQMEHFKMRLEAALARAGFAIEESAGAFSALEVDASKPPYSENPQWNRYDMDRGTLQAIRAPLRPPGRALVSATVLVLRARKPAAPPAPGRLEPLQ
ncbi:MAG TPA: class I SAM-dependent methyltransferase [Elusimicrobiota bacterium]|jgi:ubiquinone/menaquinone biosynthesis C-methylase UbiE|nr:class I SAM-dependent methyltransferase [Elusimicrobiota bacterium]